MSALIAFLVFIAPPCPSDDGGGRLVCGWDASAQGNGTGADFLLVGSTVFTGSLTVSGPPTEEASP